MALDISRLRADTPCENTYLNHVSASVPPRQVAEAVNEYFQISTKYGATSAQALALHKARLAQTRELAARLIHADGPEEILMTPNASAAVNIVAGGLALQPGENVILDETSFIGNAAPWLLQKERNGVEVRFCPCRKPGVVDLAALRAMIDANTRVIALTHMSNSIGTVQPAAEVGQIAAEAGALYFLDAASSIGLVELDVKKIGCHFLAAAGRKNLRGPSGSGFLYVEKAKIARMRPLYATWNSGTWHWRESAFQPAAGVERLSLGDTGYPAVYGLGAALRYLQELGGVPAVFPRVQALTDSLLRQMRQIKGMTIYGPETAEGRAGTIGFNLEGFATEAVTRHLNDNQVGVMGHSFFCPGMCQLYNTEAVVRFCVHYWNTEDDLSRAVAILRQLAG